MSRKRGEASLTDELRRAGNPLCMYNNTTCDGGVSELKQEGSSFGQSFSTTAVVCEAHYRLLAPSRRGSKPKIPPAEQLELSL